jgi:hypothetical protein
MHAKALLPTCFLMNIAQAKMKVAKYLTSKDKYDINITEECKVMQPMVM